MTASQNANDWRQLALHPGILREGGTDGRLVLWVPGEREDSAQCWQRVSSLPRGDVRPCGGLLTTPATAIRARQRHRGLLGALWDRFRRETVGQTWQLPDGGTAQQCGQRQTDLLLVWTADPTASLSEPMVRELWSQCARVLSLGPRLCLIERASAPAVGEAAESPKQELSAQERAERALADARREGRRSEEALALVDLGLLALDRREFPTAIGHLEQALPLAQAQGEPALLGEVLSNLGWVLLSADRAEAAQRHLEQALGLIRAVGDRFAEKLVLDRLAGVHARRGNLPAALRSLDETLGLARALGDRLHEVDVLWKTATAWADLGQREKALQFGEATVGLQRSLGRPQAEVYRQHLEKYRGGDAGSQWPETTGQAGAAYSPSPGLTGLASDGAGPDRVPSGPGYLRMAATAAKALYKFVGSGLKTVSPQTLQERLTCCGVCDQCTGMRCRVCGCFTHLKARLPLDDCPLGRWPRIAPRSGATDEA
jgi:tetratricopeptide (TPR) repeat protein